MSDKNIINVSIAKNVEDSQVHREVALENQNTNMLVKFPKKKPISSNFGRPRKHPYKPGKYKCPVCEILCSKPSVLTKHMRAHTNERPFPCSVCKRSFKTKSNLSKHEKSKSHSSKLGENNMIHSQKSKGEKDDLMLQKFAGLSHNFSNNEEDSVSIEFESKTKSSSNTNSSHSSQMSNDEKSITSNESLISDTEKDIEEVLENVNYIPETTESASSCSGFLTINSQSGPITVEVQINLETMRHIQFGLSNMNNKKYSSCTAQPISSRNEAELKAAELILHMANQAPKEEFTSNGNLNENVINVMKVPDIVSSVIQKPSSNENLSKLSPIPSKSVKPLVSSDKLSNNSTTVEELGSSNFNIKTKCLVKENLLKKMKKKQVQKTNDTVFLEVGNENNSAVYQTIQTPKIGSSGSCIRQKDLSNKNENFLKILKSDSKATKLTLTKPIKVNSGLTLQPSKVLNSNSHITSCFTTTCNSQTVVLFQHVNSSSMNIVSSDFKPISTVGIALYPESCNLSDPKYISNFDNDAAILSKVITNTQSLHQHQGNKILNPDNLSVTNSFTSSRVAISSTCVEIINSLDNVNKSENSVHALETDQENSYQRQSSDHNTQELENELSPHFCIYEEYPIQPTICNNMTRSTESDEEIDVVNTDSEEEKLQLQGISKAFYSETVSKRSKFSCEDNKELNDIKRIKELEKCVPLHAPNINAKDLMQDCPLNLSANRQPTIPFVSQISASVLQTLYPIISPSNIAIPSSTSVGYPHDTDPHINSLINYNPAHPQSFQNFSSESTCSTNEHHHEYQIFEDKICCEICSQMIERSMLSLHKNLHIFTNSKESHQHGNNNNKLGSSNSSTDSSYSPSSKTPFNKPRNFRCVVCNIGFRVIGHLHKHHKSKAHLQGLVNSGLLSKALFSKIEQSKVPTKKVIDHVTGNIIPDILSRYIANWSKSKADNEHH